MADWKIYTGDRVQHDGISRLPKPPPWRTFDGAPTLPVPPGDSGNTHSARQYRPSAEAVDHVNAALYLRRPLLVTGPPGTGKSTLAYAVAHELGLGPVLHWPITSRVVLRDGLYEYDPLTRLYAAGRRERHGPPRAAREESRDGREERVGPEQPAGSEPRRPAADPDTVAATVTDDIGGYIRLGPLGTALLPHEVPRVLLIDEIDKSDVDLPNDLLTIFEKGSFEIVELARRADPEAWVMTADRTTASRVPIQNGTVTCNAFPLIVLTSNGEREFPPAFLRRCVTVELTQPTDAAELEAIVAGHLGAMLTVQRDAGGGKRPRLLDVPDQSAQPDPAEPPAPADPPNPLATPVLPEQAQLIIDHFLHRQSDGMLANDQLLNAVYLCHNALRDGRPDSVLRLANLVMPYLSTETGPDVR